MNKYFDKKILWIPVLLIIILCSMFVSAVTTTYDILNFSNGNTFGQHYSSNLRDYTGYTSDGGVALYNLADNASGLLEDKWGSSDGTRNNGQTGVVFDGVDDYIDLGLNYITGNNPQTVCINSSINEFTDSYNTLFFAGQGTAYKMRLFTIRSSGILGFYTYSNDFASSCSVNINTDFSACFTWNTTDVQIYKDGVSCGSKSLIDLQTTTGNMLIGDGFNGKFNGSIYNVTIWDRALSDNEIQEFYNKNKPETRSSYYLTDGLVAGYDFALNQDSDDISGNGNDGTDTNVDYIGTGAVFDGLTSNIQTNYILNTTDDYSMFFNINPNDFTIQSYKQIIGTQTVNRAMFLRIYNSLNNSRISYYIYNGTNYSFTYFDGIDFNINNNIIIKYNSTNKNASIYHNGIYKNSMIIVGNPEQDPTNSSLQIGKGGVSSIVYNGTIDSVMIFNRSLSDEEILALNNEGNFVNDKNGESDNAIEFDSNEYLVYENDGQFDFNRDFSVSAWFNTTGKSGDKQAIASLGKGGWYFRIDDTGELHFIKSQAVGLLTANTTVQNDTWNHAILTVDSSGVSKIYLNGVLDGQTTIAIDINESIYDNLWIGTEVTSTGLKTEQFNGSIDEVRIYDRAFSELDVKNLYASYDKFNQNISSTIEKNQTNNELLVNLTYSNYTSATKCGVETNNNNLSCINQTVSGSSGFTIISCVATPGTIDVIDIVGFCEEDNNKISLAQLSILVDTVTPIITYDTALNKTLYINDNIVSQFNFSDDNMYRWNVSIDGVTIDSAIGVNYTEYIYNLSYPSTVLSSGTHKLVVELADGHTATEIDEYNVDNGFIFNNKIEFETNNKNKIEIQNEKSNFFDVFDYEKKKDRYEFNFDPYLKSEDGVYSLIIKTQKPINVLEDNSKYYKKWIITGDNWVDFYSEQIDMDSLNIEVISPTIAKVTFKKIDESVDKIYFKSVGDLNIVNVTFDIYTISGSTILNSSILEQTYNPIQLKLNLTGTPYGVSNITTTHTYNNTLQNTTTSFTGGILTYTSTVLSPSVAATGNVSGYWNISVSGNFTDSIEYNQTITNINIGNCLDNPTWYKILTINCYDEEFGTNILNTSIDMAIDIIQNDIVTSQFGLSLRNNNTYDICVQESNTDVQIDSRIDYYADNYAVRKYYLNNYNVSPSNATLSLYLLNESKASQLDITVFDKSTGDALAEHYVKMQRYYPNLAGTSGAYKTVEVEKTNINGGGGLKVVLNDVWYKFIIEDSDGVVVETTENEKILSQTKLLPVQPGEDQMLQYNEMLGMSSEVDCDKNTKICTFTWSNPDNTEVKGELRVLIDNGFRRYINYSSNLTATAGTIIYELPGDLSETKYVVEGWIHK